MINSPSPPNLNPYSILERSGEYDPVYGHGTIAKPLPLPPRENWLGACCTYLVKDRNTSDTRGVMSPGFEDLSPEAADALLGFTEAYIEPLQQTRDPNPEVEAIREDVSGALTSGVSSGDFLMNGILIDNSLGHARAGLIYAVRLNRVAREAIAGRLPEGIGQSYEEFVAKTMQAVFARQFFTRTRLLEKLGRSEKPEVVTRSSELAVPAMGQRHLRAA